VNSSAISLKDKILKLPHIASAFDC